MSHQKADGSGQKQRHCTLSSWISALDGLGRTISHQVDFHREQIQHKEIKGARAICVFPVVQPPPVGRGQVQAGRKPSWPFWKPVQSSFPNLKVRLEQAAMVAPTAGCTYLYSHSRRTPGLPYNPERAIHFIHVDRKFSFPSVRVLQSAIRSLIGIVVPLRRPMSTGLFLTAYVTHRQLLFILHTDPLNEECPNRSIGMQNAIPQTSLIILLLQSQPHNQN